MTASLKFQVMSWLTSICLILILFYDFNEAKSSKRKKNKSSCTCPFGVKVCGKKNITKTEGLQLFPGLFINKTVLEDTLHFKPVGRIKTYEMLRDSDNHIDMHTESTSKLWLKKRSVPLNKDDVKPDRVKRQANCECCETSIYYIAPLTVTYNEKDYKVTHFDADYQVIAVGQCRNIEGCGSSMCLEEFRLHWILIEDSECSWDPKNRFIPIAYPNHCACINIGR